MLNIGPCNCKFGDQALGKTKGGVKVNLTADTTDVETDQSTAIEDSVITKIGVKVTTPLAETDLVVLQKVIPGSTLITDATDSAKKKLVISGQAGAALSAYAAPLILTPTSGDPADQFTVYKAAPAPNIDFAYEKGGQRVYNVEFSGFVDTDGNLCGFGDQTAEA